MNSEDKAKNQALRVQILESEFRIMMEKEVEMRDLYNEIIDRAENNFICKKVMAIRDDEIRHIGYVEIMLSLLGIGEGGQ
jgi:rubrerythrin